MPPGVGGGMGASTSQEEPGKIEGRKRGGGYLQLGRSREEEPRGFYARGQKRVSTWGGGPTREVKAGACSIGGSSKADGVGAKIRRRSINREETSVGSRRKELNFSGLRNFGIFICQRSEGEREKMKLKKGLVGGKAISSRGEK